MILLISEESGNLRFENWRERSVRDLVRTRRPRLGVGVQLNPGIASVILRLLDCSAVRDPGGIGVAVTEGDEGFRVALMERLDVKRIMVVTMVSRPLADEDNSRKESQKSSDSGELHGGDLGR
ncbi:hypothetical protein AN958_00056 [Leucoagaricus sp. SymC.cos]|nr:hypothetical protein AN958_00056 [Leucoagaricus sp. SymC.cos]